MSGKLLCQRAVWVGLAAILLNVGSATAEVLRIQIDQREPFADGQRFGSVGAYERLRGRIHLEVDPKNPANQRIADLQLAPTNARGMVECWTDFFLLKPLDPARGNGRILYDVHNRGNKLALWTFNDGARSNDPATLAHAGNGFLMRHGYSILWTGWSGDVIEDGNDRLLAGLPIARHPDGPVTGKIYVEICTKEHLFSQPFFGSPWGVSDAYPAVDLDHRHATLTMRRTRSDPAVEIPHDRWALARWEDGRAIPDPTSLYIRDGFRPGWLYELLYTGKDPRVSGLGLAALRDSVSFFRYASADPSGTPNPLAGHTQHALMFGISQSGRLAHHFIYDGFNADQAGRVVFEGVLAHVAGAGKGLFNHRFGMATSHGTQHQGNLFPSEYFPFAPVQLHDPITGEQGDTLARARLTGHVPKIIFTQSSSEYWNRGGSLLHTDTQASRDLDMPPDVRIYLVAGSQHLGAGPTTRGSCQYPRNPLDDRPAVLRAMLLALDAWVAHGHEPPPSRYPRLSDATLVDLSHLARTFPTIPGVQLPRDYYKPLRLDLGPRFHSHGIADNVPPTIGPPYQTLLPAVDLDGNEIAGIRLPDVAVPLGTYTGWNLRDPAFGPPEMLADHEGAFFPFPRTPDQRAASADPRPSILERYPTRESYLGRITQAALQLQTQGFLLEEDVLRILRVAAERDFWSPDAAP